MPIPARKVAPITTADWIESIEGVEDSFPEMINEDIPAVFSHVEEL
jgi:hypothetical protein